MRYRLTEESSISTKVRHMTVDIRDTILRKLQYTPKFMSNTDECIFKKGAFIYKPNDLMQIEEFTVSYVAYCFDDLNEYKSFYKINKELFNCEADYEKRSISLRFGLINDKVLKEFDGELQHELSHLFQTDNGQIKNEELYNKVTNIAKNSENEIDQKVAYALYMTFNTEIDAFTNQYYAYLKQNNISLEYIKMNFPNGEGNPYNSFDYTYDFIVKNEGKLNNEHMKELFGLNIEQIFKRLENAGKRYKNKMMKVISLYKKEFLTKQTTENKHHSNLFLTIGKRLNFEMECFQRGIYEKESEFD